MTRLELYNLVWSTPTSQLSKTLGYSDVGIAKICRKHKIPCPPRGYWAKKQAGQTPWQIPLPDPANNSVIELRVPNMNHVETPKEQTKVDRPPIKVAESLRSCHSFITLVNQELQGAETNDNGILVLPKERVLDVRVSKGSLRRALLLFDAILKTCEASSYTVDRGPTVTIQDAKIPFGIVERLETKQEQPKEHDLDGHYDFGYNRINRKQVPSGRLELFIDQSGMYWAHGCRFTWRDGKKPLEQRLNSFMDGLEDLAVRMRAHLEEEQRKAEQRRVEELRRQEEARQRAEKRAKYDAERARVEQLRQQARCWKEADDLRRFIDAVKRMHGAIEPGSEIAQWLDWATQQADRLDPLRPSPPSTFDEKIEEVKNEQSNRRPW
ncbi:MAG TPA: hypothetical protein VE988_23990 [Gemmataceae bacterium]|nr:hypothetical protein [Gemmataceae bacterium]